MLQCFVATADTLLQLLMLFWYTLSGWHRCESSSPVRNTNKEDRTVCAWSRATQIKNICAFFLLHFQQIEAWHVLLWKMCECVCMEKLRDVSKLAKKCRISKKTLYKKNKWTNKAKYDACTFAYTICYSIRTVLFGVYNFVVWFFLPCLA